MSAAITYTHRTVKGHMPARIVCTDMVGGEGQVTLVLILEEDDSDPTVEVAHTYTADLQDGYRGPLEPMPGRVNNWMASDEEGMFTSNCLSLAEVKNEHPDAAAYVNIVTENGVPVSMEVVKP